VNHAVTDTLENAKHEILKFFFLIRAEQSIFTAVTGSRIPVCVVFISCLDEITTKKTVKPNKEPVNTETIYV